MLSAPKLSSAYAESAPCCLLRASPNCSCFLQGSAKGAASEVGTKQHGLFSFLVVSTCGVMVSIFSTWITLPHQIQCCCRQRARPRRLPTDLSSLLIPCTRNAHICFQTGQALLQFCEDEHNIVCNVMCEPEMLSGVTKHGCLSAAVASCTAVTTSIHRCKSFGARHKRAGVSRRKPGEPEGLGVSYSMVAKLQLAELQSDFRQDKSQAAVVVHISCKYLVCNNHTISRQGQNCLPLQPAPPFSLLVCHHMTNGGPLLFLHFPDKGTVFQVC